jgi:4-hydroxybenzoate polyprenyltransferase
MTAVASRVPLCVDLDGTLVRTDCLHECLVLFAKKTPLSLGLLPAWLLKGKAVFKQEVGARVVVDFESLPYRQSVLGLIETARAEGRPVVLATAAPRSVAEGVAQYLGVFDEVLSSTDTVNLSAQNKADALERRFGRGGFDYIGNSKHDLPVLARARRGYLVNGPRSKSGQDRIQHLQDPSGGLRAWGKALRLHQWLKNLLLFVPLLASHRILEPGLFLAALAAFIAFSLCASSVYVLNDLLDLSADRRHPKKKNRPFASGTLSAASGIVASGALFIAAAALALFVRPEFAAVLLLYFALTTLYSFWLKRQVIVDVMLLGALYTLRIIAGSVACGIAPSFWLLAFSMFIFFCLALVKRYSELLLAATAASSPLHGRGYSSADLPVVLSLGTSSGMVSALVLALYTQSQIASEQYSAPEFLWFAPLLLLYWVARIWMKAQRGEVDDDPVVFAAKDWQSLVTLALMAAIVGAASTLSSSAMPWQ